MKGTIVKFKQYLIDFGKSFVKTETELKLIANAATILIIFLFS
ncbi:hypothetical protein [Clostridium sp.]|jgi:hypothetical protein|nr:hypothetical protein [Clostridium sp.]MDF2503593.1 hypothetical protein [Clostridium sp.]